MAHCSAGLRACEWAAQKAQTLVEYLALRLAGSTAYRKAAWKALLMAVRWESKLAESMAEYWAVTMGLKSAEHLACQ